MLISFMQAMKVAGVRYVQYKPGTGWVMYTRRRAYLMYSIYNGPMRRAFGLPKKALDITTVIYRLKRGS